MVLPEAAREVWKTSSHRGAQPSAWVSTLSLVRMAISMSCQVSPVTAFILMVTGTSRCWSSVKEPTVMVNLGLEMCGGVSPARVRQAAALSRHRERVIFIIPVYLQFCRWSSSGNGKEFAVTRLLNDVQGDAKLCAFLASGEKG